MKMIRETGILELDDVMTIERQAHLTPWTRLMFELSLQREDTLLGVYIEQRLCGYAMLQKIADEWHLHNIAVNPVLQGQGIGRYLLDAIIQQAREQQLSVILLEVRESNVAARHLYEKSGFKTDGVRPNYYAIPGEGREDAVMMSCIL
ncbi:ribosomal protein S18-alanine N-acetyltransferase [Oceanospirillum sediminis]|uniref:[Ribosomal protein bS18]-alanine N-acetyltransferase n=1 Tax=Oceanospirillum sediminis TaxID=2760088 RepID=A0A839IWQ6_9GAMM|nr:ribosomal protein S18-alanine N-acetyltransferase [Oceanospirillum sediminis]MBB1488807.1 ribosomal protein S18-alanine N-acetyltransferase [Oceanospirillum sediminis]